MAQYVSVTSLNKYLKAKFAQDPHLRIIYLKGELSNVKKHQSGHYYFTLKDEASRINAVMFIRDQSGLDFVLKDGQQVLIEGSVSVFDSAGTYQLYAKNIKLDGFGNLFVLFEKLKKQLEQEGLFDQKYKKQLPLFPKKIAVISAPKGAALQDVLTTLKRRYPIATVTIFPCLVQGKLAANDIKEKIALVDSMDYDVLILARGGGSIEDLWAFNEQIVAREIFKAIVPIVSAIGHETDFTIADFVSDMRAPTPTAAAELVTPNKDELLSQITQQHRRLCFMMNQHITKERTSVMQLSQHYILKNPMLIVNNQQMVCDNLSERLTSLKKVFTLRSQEYIQSLITKAATLVSNNIFEIKHQLPANEYLELLIGTRINVEKQSLGRQLQSLSHLNPLEILKRGYAIASDVQNQAIISVEQVQKDDMISIKVSDGEIKASVKGIVPNEK